MGWPHSSGSWSRKAKTRDSCPTFRARTSPMRFDPKIIPGEEPPLKADGQLDLPDELAALAAQLGDDAAHLAACYPPPPTGKLDLHAVGRPRQRIAAAAALIAGSALTVLLVFSVAWWRHGPPVAIQADASPAHQSAATSFTSASVGGQATVSLTELSGPEFEAFIDLLQREPDKTVSVSF